LFIFGLAKKDARKARFIDLSQGRIKYKKKKIVRRNATAL
jgi:hypothetical protein